MLIELDGRAPDLDAVRSAVGDRLGPVPRLAQRVRRVPFGCGRPVWEDVAVDLDQHVRARSVDESDLLGVAAAMLSEPLDAALSCGHRLVVTVMCAPESAASADALTADLGTGLAAVAELSDAGPVPPRLGS